MSIFNNITASEDNKTANFFEDALYRHKPGKISISNRNAEISSSVIISDHGVTITSNNATNGITVADQGVSIQGPLALTSKGENIKKGEYSENPRGSKMFTYQETTLIESIPTEIANQIAGQTLGTQTTVSVAGTNQSVGLDGTYPIITDPPVNAAGGPGHFHTISMKHVHRIEPAYLYRIPSIVNIIVGATGPLKAFFAA